MLLFGIWRFSDVLMRVQQESIACQGDEQPLAG